MYSAICWKYILVEVDNVSSYLLEIYFDFCWISFLLLVQNTFCYLSEIDFVICWIYILLFVGNWFVICWKYILLLPSPAPLKACNIFAAQFLYGWLKRIYSMHYGLRVVIEGI